MAPGLSRNDVCFIPSAVCFPFWPSASTLLVVTAFPFHGATVFCCEAACWGIFIRSYFHRRSTYRRPLCARVSFVTPVPFLDGSGPVTDRHELVFKTIDKSTIWTTRHWPSIAEWRILSIEINDADKVRSRPSSKSTDVSVSHLDGVLSQTFWRWLTARGCQ